MIVLYLSNWIFLKRLHAYEIDQNLIKKVAQNSIIYLTHINMGGVLDFHNIIYVLILNLVLTLSFNQVPSSFCLLCLECEWIHLLI
jgi:hypothetical protein